MTKRFTISFLFIVFFSITALHAQLTEGTRFLGTASGGAGNTFFRNPLGVHGGLAELSAGFGDNNLLALRVSPDLGYFISDNVMVGSTVILSVITNFDDSFSSVGAIPFLRYYFNPTAANTYFYGQAQAGFLLSLDDSDFNSYPFSVGGGITHMLAPGVGLDGFLQLRDFDLGSEGGASLALGAALNIFLNEDQYSNRSSGTANLQTGSVMIGGTGGVINLSVSDNTSTAIALEPQLMYFVTPQLAVGGGLLIEFVNNDFAFGTINSTTLGLSPQVRYYFAEGGHRLWFLTGGIDFNYRRVDNDFAPGSASNETTANFAVGAGLNSFISENVALELGPSLRIDPDFDLVRLGVDLGVQIFLNTAE